MGGPVDSTGGPFGSVGDPFSPAGVVFRPVSARLITVRLVGALVGVGAPAAVLAVGAIMWSPWIWTGVMVMAVLAAWVAWFVPRQVRAMGYALTDDHLLWRKGIMFRRICVVPYGRMQYVDTSQGPLAAWLGIAEVRLHTAAAATDATINGLPVAEAENLRRVLSQTRSLHGGSGDPTIAYLTDPRAAGRRVAAFAAAYDPRPGTWPGFPFTPAPASWRRA